MLFLLCLIGGIIFFCVWPYSVASHRLVEGLNYCLGAPLEGGDTLEFDNILARVSCGCL